MQGGDVWIQTDYLGAWDVQQTSNCHSECLLESSLCPLSSSNATQFLYNGVCAFRGNGRGTCWSRGCCAGCHRGVFGLSNSVIRKTLKIEEKRIQTLITLYSLQH